MEISGHFLSVIGVFVWMRLDVAVHFPLDRGIHAFDGDVFLSRGGFEKPNCRPRNAGRVREPQTHLRARQGIKSQIWCIYSSGFPLSCPPSLLPVCLSASHSSLPSCLPIPCPACRPAFLSAFPSCSLSSCLLAFPPVCLPSLLPTSLPSACLTSRYYQ